jgi:hypothetical protein
MIVFVAGMSRSGSMWTYNVTRALLTSANKMVIPKDVPTDPRSLVVEALSSIPQENLVYCIKAHLSIKPNLPGVKIICNLRIAILRGA